MPPNKPIISDPSVPASVVDGVTCPFDEQDGIRRYNQILLILSSLYNNTAHSLMGETTIELMMIMPHLFFRHVMKGNRGGRTTVRPRPDTTDLGMIVVQVGHRARQVVHL
jgi:hypothetical protein